MFFVVTDDGRLIGSSPTAYTVLQEIADVEKIGVYEIEGERTGQAADYSKGVFWKGLPQPLLKYDKYPQSPDVLGADARCLPLPDQSVGSVMFDPPFVAKNTTDRTPNGKIEMRFGGYATVAELWQFYHDALVEFRRLLRPGGVLVFKCQDMVSGGKQHWSHCEIWRMAIGIGYTAKDLYIKYNPNVLWSPNMRNQQHARRTHSYFWVFIAAPPVTATP